MFPRLTTVLLVPFLITGCATSTKNERNIDRVMMGSTEVVISKSYRHERTHPEVQSAEVITYLAYGSEEEQAWFKRRREQLSYLGDIEVSYVQRNCRISDGKEECQSPSFTRKTSDILKDIAEKDGAAVIKLEMTNREDRNYQIIRYNCREVDVATDIVDPTSITGKRRASGKAESCSESYDKSKPYSIHFHSKAELFRENN